LSTQADIDLSYSVDNEFFELWLDADMNYTCALFSDTETWSDSLEDAQRRKLAFLSDLAHIGPGTASVLDIGCGWGANLAWQATVNQVADVQGITLSRAQYEYCAGRAVPHVSVELRDYRAYAPGRTFDAAMCICMMEHIASRADAQAGLHIDRYRDFFRRVHEWTVPGAYFALQAITTNVVPRDRRDLEDMRHANNVIFPGGRCPRVEDLIVSVNPYFEIVEMFSRRLHYRRTAECWLERLRLHRTQIESRWGGTLYSDYERYLAFCVRAFERHYQSLHQFSLRRRQGTEFNG
jgi:cyclopropane-fatty-acyl-phospholipid synthase